MRLRTDLLRKDFKEYPKEYEDTKFPSATFQIEKASSTLEGGIEEYTKRAKEFAKEVNETFFRFLVFRTWLSMTFMYDGRRRRNPITNGFKMDTAFSHFLGTIVNDRSATLTLNKWYYRMVSYLHELFPNFLEHDPWKEPEYFKYPFEHVGLDHMLFVYQVPARFNLLQIAEDRKMSYNDFFNYVVNYCSCVNEYEGDSDIDPIFTILDTSAEYLPYVRYKKFNLKVELDRIWGDISDKREKVNELAYE